MSLQKFSVAEKKPAEPFVLSLPRFNLITSPPAWTFLSRHGLRFILIIVSLALSAFLIPVVKLSFSSSFVNDV
jgi:hypothetical protein